MPRRRNPSFGSAVACLRGAAPGCILALTALALFLLAAAGPARAGGNNPNGGKPCPPAGNPTCGDPITIGSGNVFEEATDYQSAGPNKLELKRYYNSPLPGTFNFFAAFYPWRTNYDSFIYIVPGGCCQVDVILPEKRKTLVIPGSAVSYAPYGNSVFVIEKKKDPKTGKELQSIRQQFVRVGEARGDFVAITEGLKAGDQVVSTGVFKLRNGMNVVVNNDLAPKPQLNPTPADS